MRPSTVRHFGIAAIAAFLLALTPGRMRAQEQEPIVTPENLTKQPKLASPTTAAALITRAYPAALRNAGVGGVVQLELTLDKSGKVEKNSAEVVAAAAPALGEAAKRVADQLKFVPAEVGGTPVRTRVIIPLVFVAR